MDKRFTPARPDLASAALRGQVEAARFVEGEAVRVRAPASALRRGPGDREAIDTELLFGETARRFDVSANGWAWVQSDRDGYVGYVDAAALEPAPDVPPEGFARRRIAAPVAAVYDRPSAKAAPGVQLSMNAAVDVVEADDGFWRLAGGGYVFGEALADMGAMEADYVATAKQFLGAPYVWGGRQGMGLDCSGLVQAAFYRAGRPCPRDSDRQEAEIGEPVALDARRPGDLVFWRGHVAILAEDDRIVHANGTHMQVTLNPLLAFAEQVAKEVGPITSVRRPGPPPSP
ncbi:MAG: C40 family peptidase [Pseudomonadota bacterium]